MHFENPFEKTETPWRGGVAEGDVGGERDKRMLTLSGIEGKIEAD